jgi:hypothetical protein
MYHSNKPGFQTLEGDAKSEVQLDPKIALFESPATILASGLMTDPAVALRNIVKVKILYSIWL